MVSCRTFTGKTINLLDPKPEDIDIRDIAHSLSLLNRWNGHTMRGRSVAVHSCEVSVEAAQQASLRGFGVSKRTLVALAGLLHDAHEAYFGDIPTNLKQWLDDGMGGMLSAVVDEMDTVIFQALCPALLGFSMGDELSHIADLKNRKLESSVCFGDYTVGAMWPRTILEKRTPEEDERLFLDTYHKLMAKVNESSDQREVLGTEV